MLDRKFTIFHLSLVPIRQIDIETRVSDSREQWLRYALKERFEFGHWGGDTLYWVPKGDIDECILGLIQRKRPHAYHQTPEEGGAEVVGEEWQGAYVLVDPTHHDEGQRVAVENDVVGAPQALMKSLADALNSRSEAPYQVESEPLFDGARFWAFAKTHGNVLKRITFDFVVPNMWGTENDLEEDLKETGQETGAERVVITMTGGHGVTTENEKIRNGVDYAERGAGTISATAQNGKKFSSNKQSVTTRIPFIRSGAREILDSFKSMKRRILGREQDDTMDDPDLHGDGPVVD